MRAVFGEVTLTDVQIDPEFEMRLRAPLKPIWQVVHRDVLAQLLRYMANDLASNGYTERASAIDQLQEKLEVGTLGVLTKERWEGTE